MYKIINSASYFEEFIYLKIDNKKLIATHKIKHYHICICINRSEVPHRKTLHSLVENK